MRPIRRAVLLPAVLTLGLALGACGGGDGDDQATTTSTSSTTSTTAAPATTTTTAPDTTVPPTAPPTSEGALSPGDPCALGSDPDCIDPLGTGQGTYLIGGADCLAAFPDSPGLCEDLDGDGYAGYPDSG